MWAVEVVIDLVLAVPPTAWLALVILVLAVLRGRAADPRIDAVQRRLMTRVGADAVRARSRW